MLISIIRENGTPDAVDETMLVKRDGVIENENELTTFVEYRFQDSDVIVHRSVHVTLKKWPEGMGAVAEQFGK